MPQQQKAVFVKEIGRPVELGTRDVPTPKDGEVLVKVTATMLLPHDAYGRDWGLLIGENLPFVLGANVAGIVQEPDASGRFKKGEHVFGMSNVLATVPDAQGLQEYAALSVDSIAKVPEGSTDDEAVTLPINLATSFMAIFGSPIGFNAPAPWDARAAEVLKDETLVVIGAGAATGKFAVHLAKLAGVERIIAIAGLNNKDELERMGATHIVDRHGSIEEVTARVHAITGAEGVIRVYDCRSMSFELATSLLSKTKESYLVALHPIEDPSIITAERPKCDAKFIETIDLGELTKGFWESVPEWLKEGKILPAAYRTVDGLDKVDEINKALDGYISGSGGKQLVVRP